MKFLVKYSYYGKEFTTLGLHRWHCKQKIAQAEETVENQDGSAVQENANQPSNNGNTVKCSCGKLCKGKLGLKMH